MFPEPKLNIWRMFLEQNYVIWAEVSLSLAGCQWSEPYDCSSSFCDLSVLWRNVSIDFI